MKLDEAVGDLERYRWCRDIIEDPEWVRISPRATSQNALFSQTLWSDATIRAHMSFYRASKAAGSGEVRLLLSLGSGLDGWPGTCHGGVIALILDDIVHELAKREIGGVTATARLDINFRRPVRTPAVVLCRAWMSKPLDGRKAAVRAVLEDGDGHMFATGDSIVVAMREKL